MLKLYRLFISVVRLSSAIRIGISITINSPDSFFVCRRGF
jgi:hypothetical protein